MKRIARRQTESESSRCRFAFASCERNGHGSFLRLGVAHIFAVSVCVFFGPGSLCNDCSDGHGRLITCGAGTEDKCEDCAAFFRGASGKGFCSSCPTWKQRSSNDPQCRICKRGSELLSFCAFCEYDEYFVAVGDDSCSELTTVTISLIVAAGVVLLLVILLVWRWGGRDCADYATGK